MFFINPTLNPQHASTHIFALRINRISWFAHEPCLLPQRHAGKQQPLSLRDSTQAECISTEKKIFSKKQHAVSNFSLLWHRHAYITLTRFNVIFLWVSWAFWASAFHRAHGAAHGKCWNQGFHHKSKWKARYLKPLQLDIVMTTTLLLYSPPSHPLFL